MYYVHEKKYIRYNFLLSRLHTLGWAWWHTSVTPALSDTEAGELQTPA